MKMKPWLFYVLSFLCGSAYANAQLAGCEAIYVDYNFATDSEWEASLVRMDYDDGRGH